MTYREALRNSLERIEDINMIPLSLPHYVMSMAAILNVVTANILKETKSDDEKLKTSIKDVNNVYTLNDLLNSIRVGNQLQDFTQWLLDQDIKECEDDVWYGVSMLGDKWNEFAKSKGERE